MLRYWLGLAAALAATVAQGPSVPFPRIDDATAIAYVPDPEQSVFPRPAILQPAISFWTKVFGDYSDDQSVVHSANYPDRVLEVLDFRDQAAILSRVRVASAQSQAEKAAKARFEQLLLSVDEKQAHPEQLAADERRVYQLYADIADPERFRKAASGLRVQRGLKERTQEALETSGKYLPHMEAVFEREGLPRQLTRLPLVESSFNERAYSKVGAAGIWQFMPASARSFMRLNTLVDDRADPWFSTEAAARHLKEDYAALGDWSLAVTAYNHGRSGLLRGLRTVQGASLADLVERYEDKRFGFASRNYYAEFLAAADVERDQDAHFGQLQRKGELRFDQVQTTQYYIPYTTLLRLSGTDEATFRTLNPAYRPDVIEGKLYVPPGHTLRLPPGRASTFGTAIAQLSASERHEQQKLFYIQHQIAKGDTPAALAKRYGVTIAALRSANPRAGKAFRRGAVIRIPTRDNELIETASFSASPAPAAKGKLVPVTRKVAKAKPSSRTRTRPASRLKSHRPQSAYP